jgi:uncharacterized protein YdcH (DUF465 family)
MDEVNLNNDVIMGSNTDETKTKKLKLKDELLTFLKSHTVYETIPENMKVIIK